MGSTERTFAGLLIVLVFALSYGGCGGGDSSRCVLTGQILREGELDSEGIQVFLPGTTYQALTDAEGRFRMSQMEPGTYTLVAKDVGYISIREGGVVLKPGEERQLSPKTLHRAASTGNVGSVEGVFTLKEMEDHSGVLVALDSNAFSTLTDEYGKFILPDIPQGDHKLSASKPGFEGVDQIPVTVFTGEKTVLSPIELPKFEEGTSSLSGSIKGLV
ncbi:MAG TPA: carboxypeptidase-like regulatory domain-containing protein, partial [bacterium]|nr:carboxypeptidase-like regulatory domain-containing protein [bacterium]